MPGYIPSPRRRTGVRSHGKRHRPERGGGRLPDRRARPERRVPRQGPGRDPEVALQAGGEGKLDAGARDTALDRLTFTTDLADLRECDLIVEAVTEDLELKNALWRELDRSAAPRPSSPPTPPAQHRRHGGRDHQGRPLRRSPLLQPRSADAAGRGGANGHHLRRDLRSGDGVRPPARQGAGRGAGSVGVHRQPAARAVPAGRHPGRSSGGSGLPRTSTAACNSGAGIRWARSPWPTSSGSTRPLRIADIMFEEYREPRYAPPPLLRRMVSAGLYGRKSGRGFYDYASDPPVPIDLGL